MRIAKYIAQAGIASRRQAEQIVQGGRVEVNGSVVSELWLDIIPGKDEVRVDGKLIETGARIYVLLNKPAGYLSAVSDGRGRLTVVDLLSGYEERLFPVGRLDYDTEGLLLLTNDGDWANRLMHPRYGVDKTYKVTVEGGPDEARLQELRQGILLEDGMTAPAKVRVMERSPGSTVLEVVIHEGRKRQVKRMCAAIGHPVQRLLRTGYAFLDLDGLNPGQSRLLNPEEVERLYQASVPKGQSRV